MPEENTGEIISPLHVPELTQADAPDQESSAPAPALAPAQETVKNSSPEAEVEDKNLDEVIEGPEKEEFDKEEAESEKKEPSEESKVKPKSPEKGVSNEGESKTAGEDEKGLLEGIISALLAVLISKKEDEKKKEPNAVEAALNAIFNLLTSVINAATSFLVEASKAAIQKFSGLANEEPQKLPTEGKENSNGKGGEEPAKSPEIEDGGKVLAEDPVSEKELEEKLIKDGGEKLEEFLVKRSEEENNVEEEVFDKSKVENLPGMKAVLNDIKKNASAIDNEEVASSSLSAPPISFSASKESEGGGRE